MRRSIADIPPNMLKPQPPKPVEKKSLLVQELEKIKPKHYDFETSGFAGLGGNPISKIKIRRVTKMETFKAIAEAGAFVEKVANGIESVKNDPDLTRDAKNCFVLHKACRDYDMPEAISAFPSPEWMMDQFCTEQIAILLNYYDAVVRQEELIKETLTDEEVEAVSEVCAVAYAAELPQALLANLTRSALIELCLRQALMLQERKDVQGEGGPVGVQGKAEGNKAEDGSGSGAVRSDDERGSQDPAANQAL